MFIFFGFLLLIFSKASDISGFSREQIIFFYLSYNLIDTAAQFLFRNVYLFQATVVSGDLDYVLLKPLNPLIRVLLGGADVLDLIMLILIICITMYFGITQISGDLLFWIGYWVLVANSLFIAASLHIFVLSIGVITVSIDHLVMIYRDITALMRIPVDLYSAPLRAVLTVVIPLGVMFTFPPKFLMRLLSFDTLLYSIFLSAVLFFCSINFWKHSLRHYRSASG
jgi:ABC-2 type transport system permease protein